MTILQTHLRAIKIGFHFSEAHAAFIRISDHEQGLLVEVIPENDYADVEKAVGCPHYCWWQRPSLIEYIDGLRAAKGNYCYRSKKKFIVNYDGTNVKPNPFET